MKTEISQERTEATASRTFKLEDGVGQSIRKPREKKMKKR